MRQLARRIKLRWPLDVEDTSVFGGAALVACGTGARWGWELGLIVFGALLLVNGMAPHFLAHISGRGRDAR